MFFFKSRKLLELNASPLRMIETAFHAQKPKFIIGALSGNTWRHQSMKKTLETVLDTDSMRSLEQQAHHNLSQWSHKAISSPNQVDVMHQDWGIATQQATQRYGHIYAVLNLANSAFPGGACFGGGSAQEENLWHRTNCLLSLLDKGVEFDSSLNTFLYTQILSQLVQADTEMSHAEREIYRQRCPNLKDEVLYKVLFSSIPRICFRGPEVFNNNHSDEFLNKDYVSDEYQSYLMLPLTHVFPFYEMRSAAPEHTTAVADQNQYIKNLRQRICAQLDTLILHGKTHAVLGAWGCGAFKNNPELVSQIYREEIEKRAIFFHHIIFPIISLGAKNNNYSIFKKNLADVALGNQANPASRLVP